MPLAIFAGFLSLNLGILNLMPIPALDGGRLVFLVIEAVRRRPINPLREQMVHQAGLLVLLGLIVLISFNDIARLGQSFSGPGCELRRMTTEQLPVVGDEHQAGEVMAITGLVPRRKTAPVRVGDVIIGGAAPIAVQSMTKTDTRDVEGTVDQIARMADAGADVVRVTCNNREAGDAMIEIVKRSRTFVGGAVGRDRHHFASNDRLNCNLSYEIIV